MAPDVFISYSNHDQTVADAICNALESRKIRCWIAPRNVTPGTEWGAAIIDGINNCRVMVFVLSGHSNLSSQVRRELERAVHKGLAILPIRIEDVQPEKSVEYFISSQHWLDAFHPPLEPHLDVLAEHVLALLDQPDTRLAQSIPRKPTHLSRASRDSDAISLAASKAGSSPKNSNQIALDPAIDHLVEILPDGRYRPWPLTRPFYSIGRERAKIALPDRHVSRHHVVLVQLGADWVAIKDSRTKKPMHVSGWSLLQRTLRSGDVLRLGKTWLVFVHGPDRSVEAPLRPMAGRHSKIGAHNRSDSSAPSRNVLTTLEDDEEDEFPEDQTVLSLLVAGKTIHSSAGSPLVIGSHASCAVQLANAGVMPFHCLLCWTAEGLIVFALGGSIRLDDRPVRKSILNNGQLLRIGDASLQVRIDGDPQLPETVRLKQMQRVPRQAAISAFYGPHSGESSMIPANERLVLGHSRSCDLWLPQADGIADRQLELLLEEIEADQIPALAVQSLADSVATKVNGEIFETRIRITIGDVVQFQKIKHLLSTALLLHFDLASDSWQ